MEKELKEEVQALIQEDETVIEELLGAIARSLNPEEAEHIKAEFGRMKTRRDERAAKVQKLIEDLSKEARGVYGYAFSVEEPFSDPEEFTFVHEEKFQKSELLGMLREALEGAPFERRTMGKAIRGLQAQGFRPFEAEFQISDLDYAQHKREQKE